MEITEDKKVNSKVFWSGEEISVDYLAKYCELELDEIRKDNKLLGKFNQEGKYLFESNVKKALIGIKKRIDSRDENQYFVVSKTLKNSYSFKLKIFEIEEKSLLAANLYLIEFVDDERFKKPLITFVAQYVDEKTNEFLNKAKYIFNIIVDGEFLEHEKQNNEEIMIPILAHKYPLVIVEELSRAYVEAMLIELEKCGEEGKKILEEFKKETEQKEGAAPLKHKDLRKKLDIIIEKHKPIVELIAINPAIATVVKTYNDGVEKQKTSVRNSELMLEEDLPKPEKKEEKQKQSAPAKSGGASKSAGKAKASGSGKSSGGGGKSKGGKGGGGGKPGGDKKKKKSPEKKKVVKPLIFDVPIVKLSQQGGNVFTQKPPQKVPKVNLNPAKKPPAPPRPRPQPKPPKTQEEHTFEGGLPMSMNINVDILRNEVDVDRETLAVSQITETKAPEIVAPIAIEQERISKIQIMDGQSINVARTKTTTVRTEIERNL